MKKRAALIYLAVVGLCLEAAACWLAVKSASNLWFPISVVAALCFAPLGFAIGRGLDR